VLLLLLLLLLVLVLATTCHISCQEIQCLA
jgi:hypothetical protein